MRDAFFADFPDGANVVGSLRDIPHRLLIGHIQNPELDVQNLLRYPLTLSSTSSLCCKVEQSYISILLCLTAFAILGSLEKALQRGEEEDEI